MQPTKEFWDSAGIALVIFALCLGVGSCSFLSSFDFRPARATQGAEP